MVEISELEPPEDWMEWCRTEPDLLQVAAAVTRRYEDAGRGLVLLAARMKDLHAVAGMMLASEGIEALSKSVMQKVLSFVEEGS